MLINFFNVDSGNKINANLIKNPHQRQSMSKIKLVNSNIDPHKQLLGPIVSSNDKYYLESEFNQFILNENAVEKLSILHVNIRSLNKNLDNLLILLQSVKYKFSILTIVKLGKLTKMLIYSKFLVMLKSLYRVYLALVAGLHYSLNMELILKLEMI